MIVEMVLPSGRFASFRKITLLDLVRSANENSLVMIVALAALTGKTDGEDVDIEEWMALDLEDATPIIEHISKQLRDATKSIKGIA